MLETWNNNSLSENDLPYVKRFFWGRLVKFAKKEHDMGTDNVALLDRRKAETIIERSLAKPRSARAREEELTEAIDEACLSEWLALDYWGCMAAVFTSDPPGTMAWERFIQSNPDAEFGSGRYLLTTANTEAMIRSLRSHRRELTVMDGQDVAVLERWHSDCLRDPGFCVVYQIDF